MGLQKWTGRDSGLGRFEFRSGLGNEPFLAAFGNVVRESLNVDKSPSPRELSAELDDFWLVVM